MPGELTSDPGLWGLEATGLGRWRFDLQSDRLWWSREMYVIFGVDPARFEPTLDRAYDFLESGSRELVEARMSKGSEFRGPWSSMLEIERPDGDRRVLESRSWSDGLPGQPSHRIIGTCRDVTLAVDLRRDRERLDRRQATILSAVGEGICGLDHEGRIVFTNPALLTLLRREQGESLEGRRLHDLVHRDDDSRESHPEIECPYRLATDGAASATDVSFRRGDGTRIEVAYRRVAIHNDGRAGTVVSFRDITARRAASRLLQTSLQQVQSLSAQRGVLLGQLAEAEERERSRIAADIHDDTIQSLAAVALRLSHAGERAQADSDRDLLADAEIAVRGVAERLRGLVFELMPPEAGRDLRAAVQTYCEVLFGDAAIDWEIEGAASGLDTDRSLVAYRLIQEALRNVAKHSQGPRVRVTFETTATELVVRVADDGVGLGESPVAPTHSGLRIIRQRAQAAGGSAQFAPGLGGSGTTIELRLPRQGGHER